jgi:hypothetical protein
VRLQGLDLEPTPFITPVVLKSLMPSPFCPQVPFVDAQAIRTNRAGRAPDFLDRQFRVNPRLENEPLREEQIRRGENGRTPKEAAASYEREDFIHVVPFNGVYTSQLV